MEKIKIIKTNSLKKDHIYYHPIFDILLLGVMWKTNELYRDRVFYLINVEEYWEYREVDFVHYRDKDVVNYMAYPENDTCCLQYIGEL